VSNPSPSGGIPIVQQRAVTAVLTAALLLTAGCSGGGAPFPGDGAAQPGRTAPGASASASATDPVPPAKGSVQVLRTVAEGLRSPWGLAPLPDGGLLVSSRDDREEERAGRRLRGRPGR
jgi:glucose/arabinose dehydrogenase